jgi:hypothetical protein
LLFSYLSGWNPEPLTKVNCLAKVDVFWQFSPHQLTNLSKLSISSYLLAMDSFHHVSILTNLEELTLDKPQGTPQKFKGIDRLGNKLRCLRVDRLFADIQTFACLSHLRSLSIVDGYNNNILKELSIHLVELEVLSLEGTLNVIDSEVKHISRLSRLRELTLAKTAVTDDGIHPLTVLKSLEILNLSQCNKLTNNVVVHLGMLGKLRSLKLFGCTAISEVGLLPLYKLPNLEQLLKPIQNRYIPVQNKVDDW